MLKKISVGVRWVCSLPEQQRGTVHVHVHEAFNVKFHNICNLFQVAVSLVGFIVVTGQGRKLRRRTCARTFVDVSVTRVVSVVDRSEKTKSRTAMSSASTQCARLLEFNRTCQSVLNINYVELKRK